MAATSGSTGPVTRGVDFAEWAPARAVPWRLTTMLPGTSMHRPANGVEASIAGAEARVTVVPIRLLTRRGARSHYAG